MAWLNCYDNPDQVYAGPCVYRGHMTVSIRIRFFTYDRVATKVPIAVAWDGSEEGLGEQLWKCVEQYCDEHGLVSTAKTRGGDGEYYATITLDHVEEGPREPIHNVFLQAFE